MNAGFGAIWRDAERKGRIARCIKSAGNDTPIAFNELQLGHELRERSRVNVSCIAQVFEGFVEPFKTDARSVGLKKCCGDRDPIG